jgi:hypothetical protein
VEGIVPHRLGSVYNARMPQEGAEQFKREFDRMINECSGAGYSRSFSREVCGG